MNTNITLAELLNSQDETIKRNAMSILKQSQKIVEPCALCDEVATNYMPLCDEHKLTLDCQHIHSSDCRKNGCPCDEHNHIQ